MTEVTTKENTQEMTKKQIYEILFDDSTYSFILEQKDELQKQKIKVSFENLFKDHGLLKEFKRILKDKEKGQQEQQLQEVLPVYLYRNNRGSISVNTSLLADHIRQNNHYYIVKKQGCDSSFVYWYEQGYYKEISPNEVKHKIKEYIPLEIRQPYQWDNTYKDLMTTNDYVDFEYLNNDERYINFRNGLLDIKTWQLVPHTHEFKCTYQLNCNYNPSAEEPATWLDYINTLSDGDNEIISTLQEWFGLNLSNFNANICKKSVALWGQLGNTGKTKYVNVLSDIIGLNNICSKQIQDISKRFGAGALYGKKALIIDDQSGNDIEDGSTFKSVTGMGMVEGEIKQKMPFSFVFRGGITFTCNSLPYIKDDKGGHMFERFLIIPCDNVIPVDKRNPNLLNILLKEKEGIVLWAISGLKNLMNNNFKISEGQKSKDANEQYRANNDTLHRFISENYEVTGAKSDRVKAGVFEEQYLKFCEENGLTALSKNTIRTSRAENNGVHYGKTDGYFYYKGLKPLLAEPQQEELPF